MQQPREERRMKREKKRYFLTKMIKKVPKGHLSSRNLSRSVDRQKSEKMIWDEISDTGMMPG